MWKPHILLADNENFTNRLITQQLKQNGFEVTATQTAASAWHKLMDKAQLYELLIVERILPDMDGISFLQRLRSAHEFKNIPVIMITAQASALEFTHAIAQGIVDFIYKPMNIDLLLFIIGNALRKQYVGLG